MRKTLKPHQIPPEILHVNPSGQVDRSLWLLSALSSCGGGKIKLLSVSPSDRTRGGGLTRHGDSTVGRNTLTLTPSKRWHGLPSEAAGLR